MPISYQNKPSGLITMKHAEILIGYNKTVSFLTVIFLKSWENIEILAKSFQNSFHQ